MLETVTSYARRKEKREDSRRSIVPTGDSEEDCSLYHSLFMGKKIALK